MPESWKSHESTFHSDVCDVHEVLASDGVTTVWSRVAIDPSGAHFHAAVLSKTARPIVLAEDEIAHPGRRWELRSSGLWADHNCETEMEHWSYGLEAFALALDDPDQLVREGVGDRVPIGWELEFESATEALSITGAVGYSQFGTLHGLLLTKDGEATFEGAAVRQHWWGDDSDTGPQLQLGNYKPGQAHVVVPIDAYQRLVEMTGAAKHLD